MEIHRLTRINRALPVRHPPKGMHHTMLVNVDNDTLRKILESPEAMEAVGRIEG